MNKSIVLGVSLGVIAPLCLAAPANASTKNNTPVRNMSSSSAGLSGYGDSRCITGRGYDFANPGWNLTVYNCIRPQRRSVVKRYRFGVRTNVWIVEQGQGLRTDLGSGVVYKAWVG